MSWIPIIINLSLLKAAVILVVSGSTASSGGSGSARLVEDASVAFQPVLQWQQWVGREIAQWGKSGLHTEGRLVLAILHHSASENIPSARWCLNNTILPFNHPPGCPECSPVEMQQKFSHWQNTSNIVDDQQQQQPCLGWLSLGNP